MRLLSLFCVSLTVYGENVPSSLLERKLMEQVRALDASITGALGIVAIDLTSASVIEYNSDTSFPQASSIKVPILMEVFRQARAGKVKLDAKITLNQSESVGGSGHLRILLRSAPITLSVRDLAVAMIETSDNTAANRLIELVGMDKVNELMTKLGMNNTRLRRRMLEPNAAAENRENVSTPMEMARLAEMLYKGKAIDAEASREMIEILKLPSSSFRESIPASVAVASKPGELTGVRVETGIVFLPARPFVLSVMSAYLEEGVNPIPSVVRLFYRHFQQLASANRYGHKLQ